MVRVKPTARDEHRRHRPRATTAGRPALRGERHHAIGRASVGKLVLAVLPAAVLLTGCGSSSAPSSEIGLPFRDDFSGPTCAWSTKTDPSVALACGQSGYQVVAKKPGTAQNIRIFLKTKSVELLSVAADAVHYAGPQPMSYGVSCWNSPDTGYAFVISPDGAWRILKLNLKAKPPETALAESSVATAIAGLGATNRISGDCVDEWWPPFDWTTRPHQEWVTRLTLSVNGRKIAVARDADLALDFVGVGLFVAAPKGGTEVRFDNFAARRARPGPMCKTAGIHYVGRTDQDRAVCFTLTPDGKRLREVGFDTAINCAGRGTTSSGSLDEEFDGILPVLGARGRIDQNVIAAVDRDGNPALAYLFRGRIRGADASGILSNKGFCESLKLKWTHIASPKGPSKGP
jgi:hypothetical protein